MNDLPDPATSDTYQLGRRIVVGTVLISFAFCLTVGLFARPSSRPEAGETRAAQDLGDQGFQVGPFQLTERSGRGVSEADLADRVWIASFIFTRCPLSCPKITSIMKSLEPRFAKTGVRLVSISVDPERDTPEVLAEYARRFDADPDRWWFLTGSKDEVRRLVTDRFKLGLRDPSPEELSAGAEAILHSEKLALVDHGKVVGYFDSSERAAIDGLIARARALDSTAPAWAKRLPAVNATLNGTCAALLTLGWVLIRRGKPRGHAATMIASVIVSGAFLACYLVYHFQVGSVPFRGAGPIRLAYFTILLSHTLLATFGVVPLVVLTLNHAWRKRFDRHARLARVTFPIWLYVSITGVVIYLMLYQLPIPSGVTNL